MGCAKKVNKLINCPIMGLLDSRVGGTSVNMITKSIKNKLFVTTRGGDNSVITGICTPTVMTKKGLSETGMTYLIPTTRSDLVYFVPGGTN